MHTNTRTSLYSLVSRDPERPDHSIQRCGFQKLQLNRSDGIGSHFPLQVGAPEHSGSSQSIPKVENHDAGWPRKVLTKFSILSNDFRSRNEVYFQTTPRIECF